MASKKKAKSKALVVQDNKIAPEAKTHSEWAASKSDIWMNCAGYINELRLIPDELKGKSNKEADRGTAAHHLLETCLGEGTKPKDYRSRTIFVFENGGCVMPPIGTKGPKGFAHDFMVCPEMIKNVQLAMDHVYSEIERLGPGTTMKLEVQCVPFADRPGMYGTGDVVLSCWPDEIVVIDYKNGVGFVDAEENTQLRYYGVGAAREEDFTHSKVTTTIIQPRCRDGGPIRSETLTMKKLLKWRDHMRECLEASEKKNAKLTPGDHCKWCEVKTLKPGGCPALNNAIQKAAKTDFDDIDVDEKLPVIKISSDPQEIAKVMRIAPMVKAWLDGHTKQAYELARRGMLPDHKLIEGRSVRKIREDLDEADVARRMEKKFGVERKDCYVKKLKSVAELEKLVPAKDRRKFNDAIAVKPLGKPKLVPSSHKGEAIPVGAELDFDDYDADED